MIYDIQFKNTDKYITSTIDNQELSLPIKEIIKKEVNITNATVTSIPLYEPIPIHLFFNYYDEVFNTDKALIDQGEISIIIKQGNKEYYHNDTIFNNGSLYDNLQLDLPLGLYTVLIHYKGDKYFNSAILEYPLTIEKRKVLYEFENNSYHGDPLETIQIHFKIYDSINHKPLSNFIIHYIFQDITYMVRSNNNGYVILNISLPNKACTNDSHEYPINIYIDNDSYYASNTTLYTYINKIDTDITITSAINDKNINIKGAVIDTNILNVKYGTVNFYIDNNIIDTQQMLPMDNGNFEFNFDINNVTITNDQEPYTIKDYTKTINVKTDLSINKIENKIEALANITDVYNRKINVGMISFELIKNNETLEQRIIEVDNNGEATIYFSDLNSGEYQIKTHYHNMFEYKGIKDYVINFEIE